MKDGFAKRLANGNQLTLLGNLSSGDQQNITASSSPLNGDSSTGGQRPLLIVDFFLSRNRDVNAAEAFLRSAMKKTRQLTKITLDAYAASHRAVREMKEAGELSRRVRVRSSQYLNNLIEQDHRRVKQRIRPMLGFKRFDHAAITISGI
jgi:hypothetical protein